MDSPRGNGRGRGGNNRGRGKDSPRGNGRGGNNSPKSGPKNGEPVELGLKVITSILMPKEYWDVNGIRDLRFLGTDGLPPKIEAPHITLLDTFSCLDRMKEAIEIFKEVAQEIEPFEVTLKELKHFVHGEKRGHTLYLEPEIKPLDDGRCPLQVLYDTLMARTTHFKWLESKKFSPHVSLGKIKSPEELARVKKQYGENWRPITWEVKEFQVMSKLLHDTVTRHTIQLGQSRDIRFPSFNAIPFPIDGTYSININWIPRGSSHQDLLDVFKEAGATKAEVEFKSLGCDSSYLKGWGHVIFKDKESRDKALQKSWQLQGGNLEIFPCD